MSFMDLLIKSDTTSAKKEVVKETPVTAAVEVVSTVEATTVDGSVVEKMLQHLSDVIEKNNQPGFDYYEFHNAVKELIQSGQAEETAYQAVFSTAKTMGLTKSSLVSSAKFYLGILDKEQKEFLVETKVRETEDVLNKQKEATDITNQLEVLRKRKEVLEKDISAAKSKINIASFSFTEAYGKITSSINEEVQKISNYIKETKEK